MAGDTGELDAEIAGQKLSLKNVNINTIATVATLVIVALIAYILYQHVGDSRIEATALVQALKEQTQALRENTCIAKYHGPADQRDDFCKQVSR